MLLRKRYNNLGGVKCLPYFFCLYVLVSDNGGYVTKLAKTATGFLAPGVLLLVYKGVGIVSVFRINKTQNYTVMSNHHFKEKKMSLKAKGLLSLMLSLPDDWDYSVNGLATLSKDGKDSVMSALAELEKFRYLTRKRLTNDKGQFAGVEYNIFEIPQAEKPIAANPNEDNEKTAKSHAENATQLNTNQLSYLLDKIFDLLSTKDAELIALYREYIQMRENIKAPLSEVGLEKLIARAKRLSNENIMVEKVLLETAIINNWKNVYPPRESELARLNTELQNTMRDLFGLEE